MIIKMIGYLTLRSIFLVTAVADSGCIAGINSRVVKRGENITFPIDHDTKSGKEYDIFFSLNDTEIVQLTCRNVDCKLDIKSAPPGSLIVYENGILIIMNSSILNEGIYKIRYKGGSREKNKTLSCFNVTVDDYLPSTIIPDSPSIDPSPTPAADYEGSQSASATTISLETLTIITWLGVVFGVVAVVGAVIFVINWWCPKKKRDNYDADVGAGDSWCETTV